jgi:hypothetical protein
MRHWVLSVLMRRLDVSYCGHETGMGYAAFGGRAEMAYPHAIKAPLTKFSFGLPLLPRKRPQRPRAADSQGPRSEPFHQRRGLVEHWQHLVA